MRILSSVIAAAVGLAAPAAFGLASVSCSDPHTHFTTRVASDFPVSGHTVSVFGIFKEGRMSADTWDELGPTLSAAFATGACQAEYRDELVAGNAPLSTAIDDYVRANGIGDELLDAVAPAATGDMIVVFTIAGKVAGGGIDGGTYAMPPTTPNIMQRGTAGYRGQHGPMIGGPMRSFGGSSDALEVSASLYSVAQHRSVALVAMRYYGDSLGDALSQLTAKLRATVPGSTCGAWNANVRVDDQRIRELVER
jgi:hypothetical protein